MNLKEKALSENLRGLGRVAVALSGGLDSAVLLHFCASVLGAENCAAITADTPQMPASETDNSEKICRYLGVNEFSLNVNKTPRSLSTGYTSIFKIIIALSVNTPYIFLDEPVLGLDANHRDIFYKVLIEKYAENPFCCVISTHLIEEVSSVIEDVIIVKNGEIIRNQTRDSLLRTGFTVAGSAAAIDEFIKDKNVIGTDSIGGLKTAYIIGSVPSEGIPVGLEISAMDLQKLFVQLTNS